MSDDDYTVRVKPVDAVTMAAEGIQAAHDAGIDPWALYRGHLSIAREIERQMKEQS